MLADCFPRWSAALRLFGSLAARSPRLRLEWARAGAISQLIALLGTGVDPQVKAVTLDALTALAMPLSMPGLASGDAPFDPAAAAAPGLSLELAKTVWSAMLPPLAQPIPPANVGTLPTSSEGFYSDLRMGGGSLIQPSDSMAEENAADDFGGMDVVEGMRGDLAVEHRHQQYPQTRAFLRLLLTIYRAHADAKRPIPVDFARPLLWAAEEVFSKHDAFGFSTQVSYMERLTA